MTSAVRGVLARVVLAHGLLVASILSDGGAGRPAAPILAALGAMPLGAADTFRSERALRSSHPRSALSGFAAQLVAQPADLAAAAGLAEAADRSGALGRTRQFLLALRRRSPTFAVQLCLAEVSFATGDLGRAAAATQTALNLAPNHPDAQLLAAVLGAARGHLRSVWSAVSHAAVASRQDRTSLDSTALERLRTLRAARILALLSPRMGARLAWSAWRRAKRSGAAATKVESLQLLAATSLVEGDEQAVLVETRALLNEMPSRGTPVDLYQALATHQESTGRWIADTAPRVCRTLPVSGQVLRQDCALNLLRAAWRRGHIDQALEFERWLDERFSSRSNPVVVARFAVSAVPLLQLLGRWGEAERLARAGLEAARETRRVDLTIEVVAMLGSVLRAQGRYEPAESMVLSKRWIQSASPIARARLAAHQARSQLRRGDVVGATSNLEQVAQGPGGHPAADLLARLTALDLGLAPSSTATTTRDLWQQLMGDPAGPLSLLVSSVVRARLLEEEHRWELAASSYAIAADRLHEWIQGQRQEATRLALLGTWRQLGARRARIALRMGDDANSLAALESVRGFAATSVKWRHVQRHLDSATIVLVFGVLGEEVWLWGVDAGSITSVRLRIPAARLADLAALWISTVTDRAESDRWEGLGHQLAAATIDVATREGWLDGRSTVIVVSDGGLERVPIDALPSPFDDQPYGERFVFARSSSLTILDRAWHGRVRAPWAVALVPRANARGSGEARRVLATMPGRMFLGPRATEEAFVREASRSSVVHFGGHAVPPGGDPRSGGLTLRRSNDADGFLDYSEIAELSLEGAVVVLLGCDTARRSSWQMGHLSRSPRSLSEAFLVAGSRSVVGSLWALNERTSREFADAFYGAGGPSAGAQGLATAKRALRKRYPLSPATWAGVVWDGVPVAMTTPEYRP